MNMKRTVGLMAMLAMGVTTYSAQEHRGTTAQQAPIFQIEALWPKTLPNKWIVGAVPGVAVDAQDHIWIVHRQRSLDPRERGAEATPPQALCCVAAPPVLEFDQAGNVLRHWGGPGPGYEWPDNEHSIVFDPKGNVWISGSGPKDDHVLKFTADGKFLLQIGRRGQSKGSNDTENLGAPTKFAFDAAANEVFIGDGYRNHRVIVFDMDTGKYKRHWGAYGNKPDDAYKVPYVMGKPLPTQFGGQTHGVALAKDGLLYVSDKHNNRVQVFKKDGTLSETLVVPSAYGGSGTAWDAAFSPDPEQRFLYMADGKDFLIHVYLRKTMELVSQFGGGGRGAGHLFGVHGIATDSKGNLYTGEVWNTRVQKFAFKGMGPASRQVQ